MDDPDTSERRKLGDLFGLCRSTISPAAFPAEVFNHHSIPAFDEFRAPVLEPGAAIESNKTLLGDNCVLVSKLNPRKPRVSLVLVAHEDHRHIASTEWMAYRPATESVCLDFFKWFFGSRPFRNRAQAVATGTTNSHVRLRPGETLRWEVLVPPLPEQRQIAEVLDTVDEAIRKTEQIIAKLKHVKQGLLHDLLTRGIDDNGELRDPDRHPEQFKDSPLGRIPKGWEVVPLGVAVPKAVYGINDSLDAGPGIPVLRMMNFKDGEADLGDLKFSRSAAAGDLLLRPGDVLFNRTNSIQHVGRTGIWRGQLPQASFASYLVRLDSDPERLRPEFLNRWLNWDRTQIRIRRFATPGVHQVNINPTNLRRTTVALPSSLEEQDAAVTALAQLDRRLQRESAEVEKQRLLKQGLMEDLLTGRVRVTPLLEDAAE